MPPPQTGLLVWRIWQVAVSHLLLLALTASMKMTAVGFEKVCKGASWADPKWRSGKPFGRSPLVDASD